MYLWTKKTPQKSPPSKFKPKRINWLRYFAFLFILPLVFYSCQKDEYASSTNTGLNRFDFETISSKEISNNKKLEETFNNLGYFFKNKSTANRYIYSEQYSFLVDTTFGVLIKDLERNLHSYNFEIKRDTITETLENLVVVFDSTNHYQTYIIDYGFPKEDYDRYDQSNSMPPLNISIKPIDFNIADLEIDLAGKCTGVTYECIESYDWGVDDDGTQGQVVGADNHEQ